MQEKILLPVLNLQKWEKFMQIEQQTT